MPEEKKATTAGAILIASLMIANFLNFGFNAFLGRALSFDDFGLLTLINTLYYLLTIFMTGLIASVNHRVAFLLGKRRNRQSKDFFIQTRNLATVVALGATAAFVVATPLLRIFFNEHSVLPFLIFSPAIFLGIITAANRGVLTGSLLFKQVGIIVIGEAVIKFALALVLAAIGLSHLTYIAIPFSILCATLLSIYFISRQKITVSKTQKKYVFPKRFFIAAIITGLSTNAFLSFDLLLAKHFLTPEDAGKYALLSLIGKMIFFLGSLLSTFMVTVISRHEGQGKNPKYAFYKIFAGTAFLVVNGVAFLGYLGPITVPFLLGEKAAVLEPFLNRYTLAIGLFTLTNTIVLYRLARKQFIFPIFSVLAAICMSVGIIFFHRSINDFTNVVLFASFINFLMICILNFLVDEGKFLARSVVDFIDLFFPLPPGEPVRKGKKRILVLNWRDTKHQEAGGAEVYVHELAKRWIDAGHRVTLFCGSDGNSSRYEYHNGMEIIRRGGFYFVYIWAFFYYLVKFRGKYDVVIDCQNGIPFFTPLYVREPVYCVMHHVHQDIFAQYLPAPLAAFASFLEAKFMPWAYKNVQFIAVSNSTKQEMLELGITGAGIEIVHNGVDISKLHPGKKTTDPVILYLGRLKAYKSIHHLIEAFQRVLESVPNARLVIAGTGEEESRLKKIATGLHLSSKIVFLGKVNEKKKLQLLQSAWVFVNPSMKEGWGITTIEANACGTPVVASDVPGLRESVNNPDTGYLVQYGDIHEMADRIIAILSDQQLRAEMHTKSRRWARGFSWQNSARKFISLV